MSKNILTKTQQYSVVIFSVALSLFIVYAGVFGATTISTNITTDGTLTVTGASTLTGAAALSSTLTVDGLATTTGMHTLTGGFISRASSTMNGAFDLDGTLNVAGLATVVYASGTTVSLTDNVLIGASGGLAVGTTTSPADGHVIIGAVSSGAGTGGRLGIGTTTPGTAIAVAGIGTTTIAVVSDSVLNVGGCIQMLSASGTIYKMYIGSLDSGTTTRANNVGTPVGALIAYWQLGSCQSVLN
ncbi:MAG: hypothetical protein Q8R26_00445 [bacterium]|nr:hypothetical protein [bacterium]